MCSEELQRSSTGERLIIISVSTPLLASLETVQKEAEESSLEQRNQNSEFREELEKIAAALNNSFSHWKELQV